MSSKIASVLERLERWTKVAAGRLDLLKRTVTQTGSHTLPVPHLPAPHVPLPAAAPASLKARLAPTLQRPSAPAAHAAPAAQPAAPTAVQSLSTAEHKAMLRGRASSPAAGAPSTPV